MTKYIETLKEDEERKRQQLANSQNFGSQLGGGASFGGNKGKWYFYNSQSKGFGKVNFTKTWGNRPLEDNWRWSDKTKISEEEEENEETEKLDSRYEVDTYISAIPTNQEEIKQCVEIERRSIVSIRFNL